MRKSDLWLALVGASAAVLLLLLLAHPAFVAKRLREKQQERKGLVRELQLTDLCLFTEASYTRHPTQADLHTPFQDHPMSLEHFPSGSVVMPPHFPGS